MDATMSPQPQSPTGNGFIREISRVPSSESRTSSSTKRHHSDKKESMNGPLYRQTCNNTVLVRRLKRKGNGPSKQLARWFVENQIGMPHNPPITLPTFPPPASPQHQQEQTLRYEIFSNAVPPTTITTSHSILCVSPLSVNMPRTIYVSETRTQSWLTHREHRLLLQPPGPPLLRPLPPPQVPGLHLQVLQPAILQQEH